MEYDMDEEEVKDNLTRYFEKRASLGQGNWAPYNPPTKKTSQTGWDLAFFRHNMVLFIEAKGIKGAFDGPFISAIGAILMRRGSDVITQKGTQPWCAGYCIALNSDRNQQYDLIRALLYKLTRPHVLENWKLLKNAGAKYVYFVRNDKKVLELKWEQLTKLTKEYQKKCKEANLEKTTNSQKQLAIIKKIIEPQNWL